MWTKCGKALCIRIRKGYTLTSVFTYPLSGLGDRIIHAKKKYSSVII